VGDNTDSRLGFYTAPTITDNGRTYTYESIRTPIELTALAGKTIKSISVGGSAILTTDGKLYNFKGQFHSYNILLNYEYLSHLAEVVLFHHEVYDGRGYLAGVAGENIPFCSRVIRVVDVFDALCSNRPYRKKCSIAYSIDIIKMLKFNGAKIEHPLGGIEYEKSIV
jgi:hypothetical protein